MDFCSGGSLDGALTKRDFTLEQKLKIIEGIASGLLHLHESGIVHRDLAARNVLLAKGNVAKISDFGLSRMVDQFERKGATASNIGPIKYMAPESLGDERVYSTKTDVWTFGITVTEIISQLEPHPNLDILKAALEIRSKGITPELPADQYPQWLQDVLRRCWNMNPDKRPDMSDILDEFASHVGNNETSEEDDSD
jgi:Eph receptor A1